MTTTKRDEARDQAIAMVIFLGKFFAAWQLYSLTVAAIMGTSLIGAFFGAILFPGFGLAFAALARALWEDSKEPWTDAGFLLFAWVMSAVFVLLTFGALVFSLAAPWMES